MENGKKHRKIRHLGTTISVIVALMLAFCMLFSVAFCVIKFRSLVIGQLESNCVSGTNVLAYHMDRLQGGEDINGLLDALKEQTNCEFTVFEGNVRTYTTVMNDGVRAVGTTLSDKLTEIVLKQGQSYVGEADILGQKHLCSYVPVFEGGKATGLIFAGVSMENATKQINAAIMIVVLISIILLVLDVIWMSRIMSRKISRPLGHLAELASSMESGNLTGANHAAGGKLSNDEVGYLTGVMSHTMSRLENYIGEISKILADISQGNLTVHPTQEYVGDFISIRDSLDNIIQKLNHTISQIAGSGSQVSDGAGNLSVSAQSLSQGSAEQASATDNLEQTFEALSERILKTAEQARQTSRQMGDMGRDIQESNQKMEEMILAMEEIRENSNEIQKIIKVIEDIAFQTNILALNAAVEAARAGTAGKGFAVVAEEVRNLAFKSQEASQSTTELIGRAVAAIEQGTRVADDTAAKLNTAASETKASVTAIDRIASDAGDQAGDIARVREEISQIASVVQANSAAAEESASISVELSAQASSLKGMVQQFRIQDVSFLDGNS